MKRYPLLVFFSLIVIGFFIISCNSWNAMWGDHSLGSNLSLLEGDQKYLNKISTMNGFTSVWQRIYFSILKFNEFTQINIIGLPVLLFLRNKHVKKAYQKRGVVDPEKTVKRALVDRKNSTVVWLTDSFMCILAMLIFFTIANLISAVVGVVLMASLNKFAFWAVCLVLTMGFNYLILWKNNKYVNFFEKFEKEPRRKRRKWAWISLGVVTGIILIMILSFAIMTKSFHKGGSI